MGASLSFLAVKGLSAPEIHRLLGLTETGVASDIDDYPRPAVRGAQLPDGWYLVLLDHVVHRLIKSQQILGRVSRGCEVVVCQVEEHDMYSGCFGFRDEELVWSVVHDSRKARDHLNVWGDPPAAFGEIEAAQRKEQAEQQPGAMPGATEVDFIFEIPVELARACCRYRYDHSAFDWGAPVFTVLDEGKPPRSRSKRQSPPQ